MGEGDARRHHRSQGHHVGRCRSGRGGTGIQGAGGAGSLSGFSRPKRENSERFIALRGCFDASSGWEKFGSFSLPRYCVLHSSIFVGPLTAKVVLF